MKIVVLDGFASNPGDLSWDALASLGELEVFDRTPPELTAVRAAGAAAVFTNKSVLGEAEFAALPELRYVGVLATGYNVVDVVAAVRHGVTVTNVPAYSAASVVQHAFALLLELCDQVALHSAAARSGEWADADDFCFWKSPLVELSGKTMGIIGLGSIGLRMAGVAAALGMKILACRRSPGPAPEGMDFAWTDVNGVFSGADVVSLHCPLTPATAGMVNKKTLGLMRPSAFLLNTARGGMVVEQDLADALNSGHIAGAGLDVLTSEPPAPDNPLLSARNCVITPHVAWATLEARGRLMDIAVDNLRQFLAGSPVNVVSRG